MIKRHIACNKCRHAWVFEPPLGRRDECPQCGADAKVCLNCRFYDPGAHHECREEQAEWVKDKTCGNFCGFFEPSVSADRRTSDADQAKAKLDGLFGKLPERATDNPEPKPGVSLEDELKKFLEKK